MTTISVSRDCFNRVKEGMIGTCNGVITFETKIFTFNNRLGDINIEWIKEDLVSDGWTIDDITN